MKFTARSRLPGASCCSTDALCFLKPLVKCGTEFSVASEYCFFMPGLRVTLKVVISVFTHLVSQYTGRKRYRSSFFEPQRTKHVGLLGVELIFKFKVKPESLKIDVSIRREPVESSLHFTSELSP